MKATPRKNAASTGRRGVVLIIVVGMLAILMLMAATLALMTRMGYKMSVSYSRAQLLDVMTRAVESYCVNVVSVDKYGLDGVPYNYEAGRAPSDGTANDENYDWPGEPWLPGAESESWRRFPCRPYNDVDWASGAYGLRIDTDGGRFPDYMVLWLADTAIQEYSRLAGSDITARFAVYFEDMGGSRIDINAAGTVGGHQNQGIGPFELALASLAVPLPGDMDAAAAGLVSGRLGPNSVAGATGSESGNTAVYDERIPDLVDKDADGDVNPSSTELGNVDDDPAEFSPIYAVDDDSPFCTFDLADLILRREGRSRAANILGSNGAGLDPAGDFGLFTVNSPVTLLAGRPAATDDSFDAALAGDLLNWRFFNPGPGFRQPCARDMREVIRTLPPAALAEFLLDLDPLVKVNGTALTTRTAKAPVIRQVAVNIVDMIDADTIVSTFTDADGLTYFGVENVPYLAECEFAVPLDTSSGIPDPADDPLVPVGKYIKLINPWNEPIAELGRHYRVRLPAYYDTGEGDRPRLRRWVPVDTEINPGSVPYKTYISVPYANDIEIQLDAADVIPARGHYIIADRQETIEALCGGNLPNGAYWSVDARLQYAQECVGRPLGTEDDHKLLRYRVGSGTDEFAPGDIVRTRPIPDGSGSEGIVVLNDTQNMVLLINGLDTGEHFRHDEGLFKGPDAPADTELAVDTSIGTAQPIYDWFEDPPANAGAVETWIKRWWKPGSDPDGKAVFDQVGSDPGLPTVVELLQDDSVIQFSRVGDAAPGTDDDEDDWFVMATDSSLQMVGDPRPSWYGWDPDADGGSGLLVARTDTQLAGPWGAHVWRKQDKQTGLPAGDTADPAWFNVEWKGTGGERVPTGDRWLLMDQEDNVIHSFPPIVYENDFDMDMYTGVTTHETRIMNAGVLPTPGALGFVHAGLPWATLSLGDYGTGLTDMVHLRNFIDYVAAPAYLCETRPGGSDFAVRQTLASLSGIPRRMAIGDFDGDGRLDVAITTSQDKVDIFYGRPRGTLERAPVTSSAVTHAIRNIAVGDFDRDGRADVALACFGGSQVTVLYGQADMGGLDDEGQGPYTVGNSAVGQPIVAADVNADGYLDLVVGNTSDGTLSVLLGQENGTFSVVGQTHALGASPVAIAAGDFDLDGDHDLAAALSLGSGNVSVLLSNGDGTFTDGASRTVAQPPFDIASGDFDGDGRTDLAVSWQIVSDGGIRVFRGQGDGTFQAASQRYVLGTGSHRLACSDFDWDGRADLAVATYMATPTTGRYYLSVLYGRAASPYLGNRREYLPGTVVAGVAGGDLNADGGADLAVIRRSPDRIVALTNTAGAPRVFGRINVNTAPAAVLRTLFKSELSSTLGLDADDLADAIVAERAGGPFRSLDDFFSRMAEQTELFPRMLASGATDPTYGFRTEALARFMSNLITVRTDLWGVRARVQLFRDANASGVWDAGEEIVADKTVYMVIDRSLRPPRIVLKRYGSE